jgi:hypothetical protein
MMGFFDNFKSRWDIFNEDAKEVGRHIATGPSMARSVKNELKEDVRNAFDEEILNKSLSDSKLKLQRGDIIGISRGPIEHFGVFFGYDQVIHFTSMNSDISMKNNRIMKTRIGHFLKGNPYMFKVESEKLVEYFGEPYSPKETIDRAKSQLGKGEYDLIVNNCEHFAFWCKFGVKSCNQGLLMDARIYLDYYDQR